MASVASSSDLYRKLVTLTALRMAVVTALLGATAYLTFRPDEALPTPVAAMLFGLVAVTYGLSLGYVALLRRSAQLLPLAYGQVAGDVAVASFLVYLTGGAESIFAIMYPLAIVNAAVLLYRNGAIAAAAVSAAAFVALAVLLRQGVLPPPAPYLAPEPITSGRLTSILVANTSAFLLTAALASYLAEQVRRTGERLTASETDYAVLADLHERVVRSVPSGILTLDAAGRISFLNPAAEAIAGLRLDAARGRPVAELFPGFAAALAASTGGYPLRGELDHAHQGGGTLRLGYSVTELRSADGQPAGHAVVFEDLTQYRAMQEQLRRSDRLAATGKLAADLAHELRNPLASMSGSIELLRGEPGLGAASLRLMDIVLREAERLNGLVTNFLAYARPPPPQLQDCDLHALLDETLRVFAHDPLTAQIKVERAPPAGQVRVRADPAQLKQVVWNLLLNAAQAMPEGGTVRVAALTGAGGAGGPGGVEVRVADTGPGIPPEHQPRIFEPFFSTKENGTGLGLATVHRIVEAHGGRVEVRSEPGRGAVFTVHLKAASSQRA